MFVKEKIHCYLSSDLVFKHIFGTNENKKFISHFLELYFDLPPNTLKNIKVKNSVKLNKENVKSRNFEMDILVELPNKDLVNIEMQSKLDKAALTKNSAYVSGVVYKNFKIGEKFKYVNKTIQLNFVRRYSKNVNNLKGNFLFKNGENIIINDDLIEIRFINVDKYKEKLYNKSVKELDLWLMLISAESKEEIDEILKRSGKYPLIKEAIKEMEKFEGNEYVQELFWQEYLINARMKENYEDGLSDGLNEGKLSIAKKMLESNKPIKEIQLFTELPLKEITKLKQKILKTK